MSDPAQICTQSLTQSPAAGMLNISLNTDIFPALSAVWDASGQVWKWKYGSAGSHLLWLYVMAVCCHLPCGGSWALQTRSSCPSSQGNIPHSSAATKSFKSGTEIFCSVKTSHTHTYTLHMMIYKNNLCFTDCMNFQVYFNMEKFQLIL